MMKFFYKKLNVQKNDFLSVFILLFFSLLFYFPLIFQGKMYATQDWGRGDLTHFNYPLHEIYGNSIKKFQFPFVTNKIYSGFEMGAEGQVGMFYIPNLILYFLLPNYSAYSFSFLFVSLFSSVGVYTFCRLRKISRLASLFAAVTFSYSLFITCHFVHMNMIQAFSLVPWFFVSIEYLHKEFSKKTFLFYVFLVTQIIFTGHPQVALYAVFAIIIYTLLESSQEKRFKNLFLVFLGTFFGVLLAMPQLLATWQLSKSSPSSNLESAQNSIELFPYTVRDFLYFLYPFPFGDPSINTYTILQKDGIFWENNTFSGFLGVLLFLYAAIQKNKQVKNLLILFFVFIVFSMGWMYFFYYIPPFSLFRLPQRSLIIVIFSFSVIAAYGFSAILKLFKKGKQVISITVIVLQFITLLVLGNTYNSPQSKSSFLETPKTAEFLKNKTARIYSIGGVSLWEKVYKDTSHGWAGDGGKAILSTKNILDPNRNAIFGISSMEGYAKLAPLRTLAYLTLIRKGVQEDTSEIKISTVSAKLLGLSSVTHIVTAKKINNSDFKNVFSYFDRDSKTTYYVYENLLKLPVVKSVRSLQKLPKTGNITGNNLASDNIEYGKAFFSENISKTYESNVILNNVEINDQDISFTTKSTGKSFFVISESYSKNWIAFVNNKEVRIDPININSLGIELPPGANAVKIYYKPTEFIKGLYVSLLGAVFLAGFIIALRNKLVRKYIS